jgi:tetratricopeptide (TPR) repeat protein
MTHESTKAIEVFYSYAHRDEKLRNALVEHLSTLRRQGYISEWHDRQIVAGTDWAQEIDIHLRSASLILLLISPSFIASDYCYGIEMQLALERHQAGQARVIPIILRPTDLADTPFATFQFLPAQGKAITTWQNRDEAFLDVARGIRTVIENLNSSATSSQPPVQSLAQPLWNVPYPRNPLFTGREHILERLATMFSIGETKALMQPLAISGLGGIGKTQLAIEYAYRFREQYRFVLWASADTRENLVQEYVAIARLLQVPEQHLQDQLQIVEAVKRWLREQRQWLLILDNADDLGIIRDFLPETHTGRILLTTRAQAMGRLARRIELDRMEQAESTLFLLRRAGILVADEPLNKASARDQANALVIVQEMDGLPLALDQAGAYIEETGCGLAGYLTRYQQRRTALLKERGGYTSDHPEPVATTWSLSFEKVELANPAAADLLRLCAFLAPDAIPEEIVTEGAADLTPVLQSLASDPFLLDAAIKALLRYSLIKRDAEQKLLSLHRLVQVVLKDAMNEEVRHEWAERTVRAVNRTFPAVEFEAWDRCRRMLTHAQACADLIAQWNIELPEAASLLYKTGSFLYAHGQYVETEPFLQGALAIGKQSLGPDHPDVALYLNDLALLYMRELGKIAEAEPLVQRALAINEQTLGPDHLNTATTLHSLADLYWVQRKLDKAELLFQRVLAMSERTLGSDHPLTANTIHALAELYRSQGKYAKAEPLFQRALMIKEQTLKPDHPYLSSLLRNMAQLEMNQGKYAESEVLLQRALAISEKTLGSDHPDTARSLNLLADLFQAQGKHEQAEPHYLRALSIYKQVYGPDHLDYWTLVGLAHLYREQGRYTEAEQLLQNFLAIMERTAVSDHRFLASSLTNLADLYLEQGKYVEAEPFYQRALAIKEQTLVPDHLSIEYTLEKYASLLRQMQRPEEAAQLEERAREIRARRSS